MSFISVSFLVLYVVAIGLRLSIGRTSRSPLYLAALCRNPTSEEMAASKRHIADPSDHKQALEDVGWAILNSKEFLFQH